MNNKGDSTHPCLNPHFTSNQFVSHSLVLTEHCLATYVERLDGLQTQKRVSEYTSQPVSCIMAWEQKEEKQIPDHVRVFWYYGDI